MTNSRVSLERLAFQIYPHATISGLKFEKQKFEHAHTRTWSQSISPKTLTNSNNENGNFPVETPGPSHRHQGIRVKVTSSITRRVDIVYLLISRAVNSSLLTSLPSGPPFPKMHNLNLIVSEYQTNRNWRTFYKTSHQSSSKVWSHER